MKKYMEKLNNIIVEFSNVADNWKDLFFSDSRTDEIKDLVSEFEDEFFEAFKNAIKDGANEDEFFDALRKLIGDKNFIELKKRMRTQMDIFTYMRVVDKVDNKTGFISRCMSEYILRQDDEFFDNCKLLGFASESDMNNAVDAMYTMVFNHASMSFSKKTAYLEFKRLTDLDDSICEYYAEIFDNNFMQLQMKILIKNYEDINRQLKKMVRE